MSALTLFLALLLPAADQAGVAHVVAASGVDSSRLSVVVGREGEAPLYRLHAGEARAPASNLKLVTAAAAVWKLGADYRFRTVVGIDDRKDLVVIGSGDPNFSGRFFDGDAALVLKSLAKDVKAKGVTEIHDLVLDATRFDSVYVSPDWPKDQLADWYCAPVAALVYNDSCYDVTVFPGARAGLASVVRVRPSLLNPRVVNHCDTVASRKEHLVVIGRAPEGGILVRGGILSTSTGVDGEVAVEDPVAFFGDAFRSALLAEGIRVTGTTRRGTLPGARPIVIYRSSLSRTLKVMLTNSQNLYAECLFKSLGDGTFPGSASAERKILDAHGIDLQGLAPVDGSGLAHANRVCAQTLYEILQAMANTPVFTGALATPGSGTLRRRYKSLAGRLRAKTGTIRGVTALSGYVEGKGKARYVFVVLANGASVRHARRLQDRLVAYLADSR